MSKIKKKEKGYILLLVMIIVSSIFLLVISITQKNSLTYSASKTISIKHEQNILFASAIAIIKSLLSFDELNKKNNNTDSKKNKDYKKENSILPLYFNFYWSECNKWLHYTFDDNHNLDGKISIYLSIDDGKFPLNALYNEYTKSLEKEKVNTSENESNQDNQLKHKNNIKNVDEEIKKNIFLEKIKPIFEKLEEKSTAFKNLLKDKTEHKSFIFQAISNYFKKGFTKNPFLLEDFFTGLPFQNKNLYIIEDKIESEHKTHTIYDIFSTSNNNTSSLFYLSPATIEFLGQKKVQLNNDTRNKIIDAGKKYFDTINNDSVNYKDVWNNLYEKTLNIEYPKELFDSNIIEKFYNKKIELPNCISALIKIEFINSILFYIVYFEKNKKYDKNNGEASSFNQEYLIKLVYLLPF